MKPATVHVVYGKLLLHNIRARKHREIILTQHITPTQGFHGDMVKWKKLFSFRKHGVYWRIK